MRPWFDLTWLERLGAIPRQIEAPRDRASVERRRDYWLRRLIGHAYRQVPFIRERMREAGLEEMRTASDLERLPPASKHDYQNAGPGRVLAQNVDPERLIDRSTSGSTGERMLVKRTWFEERLLNLFRWRTMHAYGYGPFDRIAVINFHCLNDPRDHQGPMRLAHGAALYRRRVFDGLNDPLLASRVAAFAPHAITGMASVIARLADEAAAAGIRLQPRFIAPTGELLSAPLRARIATLGAPIYDIYGSNELNLIASECPRGAGTYHLCDDALFIEVLDSQDRPVEVGQWGEVVATSLFSYAMPFVRYRLGDVAVRGPERCPCGAAFSTLLAIRGRTFDSFCLSNGGLLHPYDVLNAIKPHMLWVKQFQLLQTGRDAIELRIVPHATPAPAERAAMESAARAALEGRATFALHLVAAIEPGPSGKLRLFVPFQEPTAPGSVARSSDDS